MIQFNNTFFKPHTFSQQNINYQRSIGIKKLIAFFLHSLKNTKAFLVFKTNNAICSYCYRKDEM